MEAGNTVTLNQAFYNSTTITNLRAVTEPDVEPNVFARAVRRFDLGFDLR